MYCKSLQLQKNMFNYLHNSLLSLNYQLENNVKKYLCKHGNKDYTLHGPGDSILLSIYKQTVFYFMPTPYPRTPAPGCQEIYNFD